MFTPNLTGHISRNNGFDVYGSPRLTAPQPIRFALVNMRVKTGKTTVRSDSSASGGAADEITSDLARILVPAHERIAIGDVFIFDGQSFDVASLHPRRSVFGTLDHFECDLEIRIA